MRCRLGDHGVVHPSAGATGTSSVGNRLGSKPLRDAAAGEAGVCPGGRRPGKKEPEIGRRVEVERQSRALDNAWLDTELAGAPQVGDEAVVAEAERQQVGRACSRTATSAGVSSGRSAGSCSIPAAPSRASAPAPSVLAAVWPWFASSTSTRAP
jgi:hypothetical protein